MLRQRLLFGSAMIALLVGLFWLDEALHTRVSSQALSAMLPSADSAPPAGLVITSLWCVVVFFATRELGGLLRGAGHEPAVSWAVLCNLALTVTPLLAAVGSSQLPIGDAAILPVFLFAAAGSAIAVALRGRIAGAATSVALTLLLIVYLGLLGSYMPRLAVEGGSAWRLLYLLLVIKSSDIGAYFTGLAFGRHKLIEWLSPKKTWEGFYGGIALAILVAVVGARLFNVGLPHTGPGGTPLWLRSAVLGLLMGLLGQAGDLFESLLKRDLKVKDSGRLVPAFGGLLDLLDSPLICVPVGYWMMLY